MDTTKRTGPSPTGILLRKMFNLTDAVANVPRMNLFYHGVGYVGELQKHGMLAAIIYVVEPIHRDMKSLGEIDLAERAKAILDEAIRLRDDEAA